MIYKLYPECKDYLWGGTKLIEKYGKVTTKNPCAESWELSFHKDGLTKIEDGRNLCDVLTKEDIGINSSKFEFFPVLIKFIDALADLSVQVHPSDDYALKYENSYGKTEMWYIVEANPGAGIYCGLKEKTSKEVFEAKVNDGTVLDLLNFIEVKKGDCYYIESGTLHAIAKGCLICEIQQNSNLTYRVYDYNRVGVDGKKRELHLEKALKVINFNKFTNKTFKNLNDKASERTLADCKYFNVKEITVNDSYDYINPNSFSCINVVEGNGSINGIEFKLGDSFFISANEKFTIKGNCKVLLTDIK